MHTAIDHLVVAGATLDAASAYAEQTLGLPSVEGGQHARMATHNRLISLGPEIYLEALAPDPNPDPNPDPAPPPRRARWFGLDAFTGHQPPAPRLAAWALRVSDLDAAIDLAPDGIGPALTLQRGDFHWRLTVPDDGHQPFDGLFPSLIAWSGPDPAPRLTDTGARLVSLTLTSPQAGRLGWALSMLTGDDRITVREGPPGLTALIHTKTGEKEFR